jgi:hypothetical protein
MEVPAPKKTLPVGGKIAPSPEAVHGRMPIELGAVHGVRTPWYTAGPDETPNVTPLIVTSSEKPQPVYSQWFVLALVGGLRPQVQPKRGLPSHAPATSHEMALQTAGLHHDSRYFSFVQWLFVSCAEHSPSQRS